MFTKFAWVDHFLKSLTSLLPRLRLAWLFMVLSLLISPAIKGNAAPDSPASPSWYQAGYRKFQRLGHSVSDAGDVNGDGYGDVIVGAPNNNGGGYRAGAVYGYYGSATGLGSTYDWVAGGGQRHANFGESVSAAGDINGDGYGDIIIGAYNYTNDLTYEGRAFVYLGSASGLSTTPAWTAEGDQGWAYFGNSVSTAGDVNGDGYSDVIVGATNYDNGEVNEGKTYVYYGSASGLSLTPDWTAESNQTSAYFGISVSAAGDVNGDGYGDVIVGASGEDRAFVYLGSASGLSATPDWTAESDQTGAAFGNSVKTAGDVNSDGYGDVIIGAPYYSNGESGEGRAFLYLGSASGLSATPDWTAESDQASAYFGASVSAAGDYNGDGYADVIVGAPYFDDIKGNQGKAYVYIGYAHGLRLTPKFTFERSPKYGFDYLGSSVSGAGNVNGDSYSDILIGAPSTSGQGAVFSWYGR